MEHFIAIPEHLIPVVTLVIFCLTYLGIAIGRIPGLAVDRTGIVMLGSIALLAFGCLSLKQAVDSISASSILLLFSLMVVASQLHFGGFYHRVAEKIATFLDKPASFLAILMLTAGFYLRF